LRGELAVALERAGELLAEGGEICFGRAKPSQLRAQLAGTLGESGRWEAVFACEVLDRGEAPLDLILARGVEVEPLEIVLHLAGRLAQLDDRALHQRQELGDL